ncbi:MAG: DapH/DapD/GlmU-related protein [Candidatus Melainabacteria bacterium]|nr:DapH/DapD/GlmU-related protein [Candidatus Melainabacteria bacterium]
MSQSWNPEFDDHRAEGVYVHDSAWVDSPCHIGERTTILHFTHVMPHTRIGQDCHIGHNVTIGSGVLIGNQVRVLNNALLVSGVILGDGVYCGPSTVFCTLNHVRGQVQTVSRVSPTVVRTGASIGPNSTVACGFTLGRFAFVEAGSVVDRSVPDYAMVGGSPLRLLGWRCECGDVLDVDDNNAYAECAACGSLYHRKAEYRLVAIQRNDLPEGKKPHKKATTLRSASNLSNALLGVDRLDSFPWETGDPRPGQDSL